MSEPIEAPIKIGIMKGVMSFDGKVLEIFLDSSDGSTRHHLMHIKGIGLAPGITGGTKLKIMWSTGRELKFGFEPENQPAVEALVQAIWAAHDAAKQ